MESDDHSMLKLRMVEGILSEWRTGKLLAITSSIAGHLSPPEDRMRTGT